jgi:sugar phosphate isomerase/epimerase
MYPALTASISGPLDIEELIRLAGRHGFPGVEGHQLPTLLQRHGEEGARRLLAETGVRIASFGLPVEWRKDDATFRHGLAQLGAHAAAAAALGCSVCATWMHPSQQVPSAVWTATAISRLRACGEVLRRFGIRFALEVVTPHHMRTAQPHPFLWDFPSGLRFCEAIDLPNVGLLVDAYHWFCSGSRPEDLEAVPLEAIVHVHINDAPKGVPVDEQQDWVRVFPGEGQIDLPAFLAMLRRKGYGGAVALEVLTLEPIPGTADEKAARAAASLRPYFAGLGG